MWGEDISSIESRVRHLKRVLHNQYSYWPVIALLTRQTAFTTVMPIEACAATAAAHDANCFSIL